MQLIRLAPHVSRLVPVADRYVQSRTENGKQQRRALEKMAEGLREDMGELAEGMRGDVTQMAAVQAGMDQQLQQQSETLLHLAAEMRATRQLAEELEARLTAVEKTMQKVGGMQLVGIVVLAIVAAGMIAVFVVLHGRG